MVKGRFRWDKESFSGRIKDRIELPHWDYVLGFMGGCMGRIWM